MSRHVILAVVMTACAGSEKPKASTPSSSAPVAAKTQVSFATWLGHWKRARACVVDPADDLVTGITLALQSGRDCSSLLHALEEEPLLEYQTLQVWALARSLAYSLGSEASVSKRAGLLDSLDKTIAELEILVREGFPPAEP